MQDLVSLTVTKSGWGLRLQSGPVQKVSSVSREGIPRNGGTREEVGGLKDNMLVSAGRSDGRKRCKEY